MTRYLASVVMLLLVGLAASPAADAFVAWDDGANVTWQGPGYYASDLVGAADDVFDPAGKTDITAGPFTSEADCYAAISAHVAASDQDSFSCGNFSTELQFDKATSPGN